MSSPCFALAALVLFRSRRVADAATLDRLRAFVRDTQTARAQFTQTVADKNGRAMQSANGTFELSRPGNSAGASRSRTSSCWSATASASGSSTRT